MNQKQPNIEITQAVKYLEQALEINNSYSEAFYLLACYAVEHETPTKALSYLEKAIKQFPLYYREKAKESKLFKKLGADQRFLDLIL